MTDKRIEHAEALERVAVDLHNSASELRAIVEEHEPVGEPVAKTLYYWWCPKCAREVPYGEHDSEVNLVNQSHTVCGEILNLWKRPKASAPAAPKETDLDALVARLKAYDGNPGETQHEIDVADAFRAITDLRAQLDYSRSVIDGLLRDIQTLKDKK